ncbi:MAG: hypothetical protein RR619_07210 [Raoultibacter sp.]
MAVQSGYYNSRGGDRRYNAEDMSKYFTGLVTRGVLETMGDKLAVNALGGMNVTVGTGKAYFSDGKWMENTALITLKLEAAPVIQSRIDRIVVRNDTREDTRACSIIVLTGTPANEPQAPALTSNDYMEEISLAQVFVGELSAGVTQANIMDERASDVCGFVYALGQKVNIEDLYRQHQAIFDEFMVATSFGFDEFMSACQVELSRQNQVFVSFQTNSRAEFDQGMIGFTRTVADAAKKALDAAAMVDQAISGDMLPIVNTAVAAQKDKAGGILGYDKYQREHYVADGTTIIAYEDAGVKKLKAAPGSSADGTTITATSDATGAKTFSVKASLVTDIADTKAKAAANTAAIATTNTSVGVVADDVAKLKTDMGTVATVLQSVTGVA